MINSYCYSTICFCDLFSVGLIHGDFDQFERDDVLKRFKANAFPILVATDVAGMNFMSAANTNRLYADSTVYMKHNCYESGTC